jgi:enediyne biosynthesis protein E4
MSSSLFLLVHGLRGIALCIALVGATHWISTPTPQTESVSGLKFVDVAQEAGIIAKTIYGGERKNKYQLENTGCGAAFFDYDNDGRLDVFLVNGTRLEGFAASEAPTNHLYHNNGNGGFTDVTAKAKLTRTGWGQGVCVGDYDNDGYEDLFVTYWGDNVLYRNNGDGTFADVTRKAGLFDDKRRWGSGCAFVDYDRDGNLDLFVANYLAFDPKTWPTPESGPCLYKGIMAACGHKGMPGSPNLLYRNNGNGTFTDVSEKSGITKTTGRYSLGVLAADFNNDDWPDIYVANDLAPAALYRNNKNGTFTDIALEAGCAYSFDGRVQAGMGVAAGDYDGDGWLDIFKTNFSDDTSTLYRNLGKESFDDVTMTAGIGINTRWLGWGCGFFDLENDGWLDIFLVNGHIYPEVDQLKGQDTYRQRKILYRNLRNGRFEDVTQKIGGPLVEPDSSRGCAFGDFDNDGDTDILINPINSHPELLRCDSSTNNNWITIRAIGTKSNRSGIGARIKLTVEGHHPQIDETRSGGSYLSQNDLRVHFGLGKAARVKTLEIRWPSGQVDTLADLPANQIIQVKEGAGLVKSGIAK